MAHAHVVPQTSSPADADDTELVALVLAGDDLAFEYIMRRYNRLLFRTARSIVRNDTEAEDVLQDAYLHAWQGLGGFRADARLSTWLVRIVVNEALGRRRRKTAQIIPLDSNMTLDQDQSPAFHMSTFDFHPDRAAMRMELRAILEAEINRLPEMYRTVFMLRAVEELSTQEVSEALQLPLATVRTRYFRARCLLQDSLASDIDATLPDAFSFDGERCDRIVSTVLSRITRAVATHAPKHADDQGA